MKYRIWFKEGKHIDAISTKTVNKNIFQTNICSWGQWGARCRFQCAGIGLRGLWLLPQIEPLHITCYTLHITRYTLHITHYTLHITHCTLHVTHYTLHVKFIAGEHYWHYGRACWALWHWSSTGATLVADFRKRDPLFGLIWGLLKLENFGILRQIAEPKSDYCWLTLYCRKNCTRIINLNLNN